ncbi:MAG: type II secretion system F family protein [Methanobacteriota archaeon]|nr:MAG: type II secretion system F family protein [Euryarchaeota archaeon]
MTNAELEKARVRLYEKSDRKPAIMATGGALMALFGFIAFLNLIGSVNLALRPGQQPIERFLFWLVFAIMGFIGPYGFFLAKKQREIKQVERRLPDFLRDVAEAGRFGMTLADAIVVSSSGRYGKLTPEIKKMAAQITWGVPATEALRLLATRVKTPMVERVVAIIVKSSDAGGDVADVLTMVSHDTKENQLTEDDDLDPQCDFPSEDAGGERRLGNWSGWRARRCEPPRQRLADGRLQRQDRVLRRRYRARPRGWYPCRRPRHGEDRERAPTQLHPARHLRARVPDHLRCANEPIRGEG